MITLQDLHNIFSNIYVFITVCYALACFGCILIICLVIMSYGVELYEYFKVRRKTKTSKKGGQKHDNIGSRVLETSGIEKA